MKLKFVPFLLIALLGCTTTPNKPIQTACSTSAANYAVERCAKAIAETWEVYQKRAEDITSDITVPADVKGAVQRAEATTRPAIISLLRADAAYITIKAQLAEGQTEADKLAIANQNLAQWVATALPLITDFGKALGL